MLELLKLNQPSRHGGRQNRWVRYKSVHFLPRQFNFIIDVRGNIVEAEAVLVKTREQ
jgi:hypothetical protein